jgi:Asp-tRNA(Asn)/Glu-tRNA(Gln) amidotransferase A subunit family amidase
MQKRRSTQEIQDALSSGKSTAKLITSDYVRAIRELSTDINSYTVTNGCAIDDAELLDVC